jgi:hypothetical protein
MNGRIGLVDFEFLPTYDGYINIYQNDIALDNIISQGNIGSN